MLVPAVLLLPLTVRTTVPVPNGTASVRVTEVFGSVARRTLPRVRTVGRATSFLSSGLLPSFVDPANATDGWEPAVCAAPFETGCVWEGGEVEVEYVAANASVLGVDTVAFPPVCNVTLANFTTTDNLTWCGGVELAGGTGELATLYPGVQYVPGFLHVVQSNDLGDPIAINLTQTTTTCGLRPVTEYFVWAGDGVAECRVTIITPQLPIQNAPVIDPKIPLVVGFSGISFYFVVPAQSAGVEHIVVTYTDKVANITREHFWTGANIVPTVTPTVLGIAYRTFIVAPAVVFPNTEYDLQVAIADDHMNKITPDSNVLTQSTRASRQAKPKQPLITSLSGVMAHVAFDTADFREYGNTSHVVFREYAVSETTLEGTLVLVVNCSGLCPQGVNVSRGEGRLLFLTVAVVNQFGESDESDTSAVPPAVAASDDGGLTAGAIVGLYIGLSILLLLLVIAVVVARRGHHRVVIWAPPTADPEIEVDRSQVALGAVIGKGFTSHVYVATLARPDHNDPVEGAAKQLKPGAPVDQRDGFVKEIQTLMALRHRNVVRILGAVTQSDPMMIVLENCANGAVNQYITTHHAEIAEGQLFDWCGQMYQSVVYIHGRNIVHRDIACRNFLLTDLLDVKICDFGLCKDVDIDTYYQRNDMDIAVRWAAPQTLLRRRDGAVRFSFGTDTWSLCASFQEVYTGGAVPYAHVQDNEGVLERIIRGERLEPPPSMPPALRAACTAVYRSTNVTALTADAALGDVFPPPTIAEDYDAESSDAVVSAAV